MSDIATNPQDTTPHAQGADGADHSQLGYYLPPPATVTQRREPTLSDLQNTMNAFMEMMDSRMTRLEGAMYYVQEIVGQHIPLHQELRTIIQHVVANQNQNGGMSTALHNPHSMPTHFAVVTAPEAPLAIQAAAPEPEATISLEFEKIETKWFTERTFPEFTIKAVQNGEVFRKAEGWRVALTLVDGNKNVIDDKMGDMQRRIVTLREGVATVNDVKFTLVSSKHGGFFRIQAKVIFPENAAMAVAEAETEDVVVLSCRLFHNPKRSIDELTSDDQLSKMPGIGRLYAERFASYNIQTIRQLASIPLGVEGRQQRMLLLNHLRRDKGTMTEPKLNEYIEKAQEIVKKEEIATLQQFAYQPSPTEDQPAAKRLRMDSPSEYQAPAAPSDVDHYLNYDHSPSTDMLTMINLGHSPLVPPDFRPTDLHDLPLIEDRSTRSSSQATSLVHEDYRTPEMEALASLAVPNYFPSKLGASSTLSQTSPMVKTNSIAQSRLTFPATAPPQPRRVVRPAVQYPLHNAVGTNDISLVRKVVSAMREGGLPLSEENQKGWTPLMFACASSQVAIVEFLSSLPEVDVGQKSTISEMTALHFAACQSNPHILQILLRNPSCDAGVVNKSLFTPLMVAVVRGRVENVRILSKIADSYRPKTQPGIGLYHLAALSGNLEIMRLIHEGRRMYCFSNPSLSSPYGTLVWTERDDKPEFPSVLHCAAFNGNPEMISWLFSQGVNGDLVNSEGWTALHFAAYCGNVDAIPVLATHVNINAKTNNGWSALALAVMRRGDRSSETVSRLIEAGAEDSGDIPANLVSVSVGNMAALETLQSAHKACPGARENITGVGQVSCMELSQFFDNTSEVAAVKSRLALSPKH